MYANVIIQLEHYECEVGTSRGSTMEELTTNVVATLREVADAIEAGRQELA